MLYDYRGISGFLGVTLSWIHPIHQNLHRTQWPRVGSNVDYKVCFRLRDPAPLMQTLEGPGFNYQRSFFSYRFLTQLLLLQECYWALFCDLDNGANK